MKAESAFLAKTRFGRIRQWSLLKKLRIVLVIAIAIGVLTALGAVGIIAFHLAFPRIPQSISSLQFNGFIALPSPGGSGALSVLDYLTLEGRNLYAASIKPGTVFKVPLDGKFLPVKSDIATIPGAPSAHGVVFDGKTHQGFISRSDANTVDVFDTATLRVGKRIPVAEGVDGIFFDSFNNLVYAVSGASKNAAFIDATTQLQVGQLAFSAKPEFAVFDPLTHLIYQNLEETNELAIVDGSKRSITDRWALTGCKAPTGIAMDSENRRLFIACSGNATLLVLNTDTGGVVASVGIGTQADSVAYDPQKKRIYTTGRPGILAVTQQENPDTYSDMGRIALEYGAHTLAVDSVTQRVYVGYVSLFTDPRLAVFDAR